MFKNVSSQKIALFAYDSTTGAPKTGDAANITPYVSKDYGTVTVLGTTTATEMDATNAKGWYSFTLAQAETNGDALLFTAKSSTSNAYIVGQLLFTDPPNYTATSITSGGRVNADAQAINSVTLAAQALAQSTQSICWGTCSGGTTTTAVVSTLNNPSSLTAANQLLGRTIIFLGNTTTAAAQAQASNITASTTGATPTITFTAMTNAPANGDVFVIV